MSMRTTRQSDRLMIECLGKPVKIKRPNPVGK